MNVSDEHNELYEEWRSLSRSETQAIRAFDWKSLSGYQKQKLELQKRIQHLESVRPNFGISPVEGPVQLDNISSQESDFSQLLGDLIQMERDNFQLLESQKDRLRAQQSELKQSSQNLRRLHKAYVSDPHAVWETYS